MDSLFKSALFKKFFFTFFLLIIVIIFALWFSINEFTVKTVEDELTQINYDQLNYIDSILYKSVLEPTENLVRSNYVTMPMSFNKDNLYEHFSLYVSLKNQVAKMSYIESLVIYDPSTDLILSSNGNYYSSQGYKYHDILEFLKSKKYTARNWNAIPSDQSDQPVNSYINCSPSSILGTNSGTCVFAILNMNYVKLLLETQLIRENESIAMNMEDGKPYAVIHPKGMDVTKLNIDLDKLTEKLKMQTIDGHEMIVINHQSALSKLHYYLIMPQTDFFKTSESIRNTILILSLSVLGIGIFLAFLGAIVQYNPIKRLVNMVGAAGSANPALNEYALIQQSFYTLSDSVSELKTRVNESHLHKILRGTIRAKEKEYFEDIPGDLKLVVAFQLHEHSHAAIKQLETEIRRMEEPRQSRLTITEVFVTPYTKDIIMAVIFFSGETMEIYDQIHHISEQWPDLEQGHLKSGVGSIVEEIDELFISCEQALRALDYHFLSSEDVHFVDANQLQQLEDLQIDEDLNQLSHAIEVSNTDQVHAIFTKLKKMIATNRYRYESVEHSIIQVMILFKKVIIDEDREHELKTAHYRQLVSTFFKKKHINEGLQWLENIAEDLCSKQEENQASYRLILQIKEYIDEHFEQELSLELLSQKTFLSPSYISLLFKKNIGIGITDYISNLRLEKACQLLENNQLKINEIAEMVGMYNTTYFITKFKKKYGYTPNQYRLSRKSKLF